MVGVSGLLLLQSLLSSPPGPGFQEEGRPETHPWIGVEALAVYTRFDDALRIKDAWGGGVDASVTLDYGTRAFLGFKVGVLGWNTEAERDAPGGDAVRVRQYRAGVFGRFGLRFLELGVGANTGAMVFRRDGDADTTMFFEFEGRFGFRPVPQGFVGVAGMQTMTGTDFSRSGHHFVVDYSIGPVVEFRF